MLDYVRVIDLDTGHELSVHEAGLRHGNFKKVFTEAGDPAPAVDVNGEPLPPVHGDGKPVEDAEAAAVQVSPYKGRLKADLEAEVANRNASRGDGDQIVVGGNGTVADLTAALEADDAGHPYNSDAARDGSVEED